MNFSEARKLISSLRRISHTIQFTWSSVIIVLAASVLSGAVNIALIALINTALTSEVRSAALPWAFAGLCLLLPISRLVSQLLLVELSERITFKLRTQLCRRILYAPLRNLEEIGAHRLLATLTNDIGAITGTLSGFPVQLMHFSIILSCFVYMAWLSPLALLMVVGFLLTGLLTYYLAMLRGTYYFGLSRERWDRIFIHLRSLTEGIKELKLHARRRQTFLDRMLEPACEEMKDFNIRGAAVFTLANTWGQLLFFVVVGLVIFLLPRLQIAETGLLTGLALSFLYMMGSLEAVLNSLPNLGRTNIAIERVEKLDLSLTQRIAMDDLSLPEKAEQSWQRLELVGATHEYRREDSEDNFTLGPIDLDLRPGEILFITGGNGSGKTTLAKMLVGLYVPQSGHIALDGQVIDNDRRRIELLELFSAVFSDFYLFDRLVGLEMPDLDERAKEYLTTLRLEQKVKVQKGELSTLELSQGQRRRLALLTAYLEDRPIYMFDEWAADQDPSFKEIFYLHLLPELKARGKGLIVISHDDRFYGVADRVVHLEDGQMKMAQEEKIGSETEPGLEQINLVKKEVV